MCVCVCYACSRRANAIVSVYRCATVPTNKKRPVCNSYIINVWLIGISSIWATGLLYTLNLCCLFDSLFSICSTGVRVARVNLTLTFKLSTILFEIVSIRIFFSNFPKYCVRNRFQFRIEKCIELWNKYYYSDLNKNVVFC